MLLKNGLGMLAQAVITKGKDAVEDKLGINLEENLQTPETVQFLRNLETRHSEFLIQASLAEKQMDADNVLDARKRDASITVIKNHNYRADTMYVLAVLVIVGLVSAIWMTNNLEEYLKGVATLILGRFLGYLDNIYNFEFGSTRSSRTKDDTITTLSKERSDVTD